MKSFLDRFRRKDGDEPSEDPVSPGETSKGGEAAGESVGGVNKVPGDTGLALPPAASAKTSNNDMLTLELGDFLRRIPEHFLKAGPHDLHLPLRFDLAEIEERVTRGETTIPLLEIYKRVPQIFESEVRASDDPEIRFPWQKFYEMMQESSAKAGGEGAAQETLAQKLNKRRAARNIGPGKAGSEPAGESGARGGVRGGKQVSWFSRTAPGSGTPAPVLASGTPPEPAPVSRRSSSVHSVNSLKKRNLPPRMAV